MTLLLGETALPVAQLGPDFLILKEPTRQQPESHGILSLTVDGVCEKIPVHLPRGIESTNRRVAIAERDAAVLSPC